MIVFVYLLLTIILLATLIGGAYIYEDIDWYTEPPRTEIEIKAHEIKTRRAAANSTGCARGIVQHVDVGTSDSVCIWHDYLCIQH